MAAVLQNKFIQAVVNKNLKEGDQAKTFWTRDFVVVPHTLDLAQIERLVERSMVVFVEQRNGNKIENVYAVTARDFIGLIQ